MRDYGFGLTFSLQHWPVLGGVADKLSASSLPRPGVLQFTGATSLVPDLSSLGRRCLYRILWGNGGQHRSWSAEYFLHSRLAMDVSASSRVWFESAGSEAYGGQFTVEVPFTLQSGSAPTGTNLVANIHSTAVRTANEVGTLNTVEVLDR